MELERSDLQPADSPTEYPSSSSLEWLAFVFVCFGLYLLYMQAIYMQVALSPGQAPDSVMAGGTLGSFFSTERLSGLLQTVQCGVLGVVIVAAAAGIWLRRWYALCLTAAAAICTIPPIGAVGGAFGFAILLQSRTRLLFQGAPRHAGPRWWGANVGDSVSLLTGAFLLSAGFALLVRVPLALLVYVETRRTLLASSVGTSEAIRDLFYPDLSFSASAQTIWIPAILGAIGVAAAILLHRRKAPRTLMALAFVHAAAFPLGTIAGVFTLLWCQEPTHRAIFGTPVAPEPSPDPGLLTTSVETERLRKSFGMN